MKDWLQIPLFATLASVTYGVVHNQFTARLSIEYFTIGHPQIVPSTSPTVVGLAWGVIATWWMGAGLGIVLTLCARLGSKRPRLGVADSKWPILIVLGVMAVSAIVSGSIGLTLAKSDGVVLIGRLAERVPEDRHDAFLGAMWAHVASYVTGALGGLVLALWIWNRRWSLALKESSAALGAAQHSA